MSHHINIYLMKTDKDMDGKGYVHWQSWQETYSGLMPPQYLDQITLERCISWAHQWPQNTLLLKRDEQVIGFSCFGQSQDPGFEQAGEVFALYVLSEYQGQGLGLDLMKATMDQLEDKTQVILWVLEGNKRAIQFYKRYGFQFDGAKKEEIYGQVLRMVLQR